MNQVHPYRNMPVGTPGQVTPGRPRVSRRAILLCALASSVTIGAASSMLSGCGVPQHPTIRSPGEPIIAVPVFDTMAPSLLWKTLAERFRSYRPDLRIAFVPAGPVQSPGLGLVGPGTLSPLRYRLVTLSPGLVDTSVLVPGLVDPFAIPVGVTALPITMRPTGVRYNHNFLPIPSVVPKAVWNISDFEDACALLEAELSSTALRFASAVMPLLLGEWTVARAPVGGVGGSGLLGQLSGHPERWLALVAGFGGWVYRNGTFDVTNPGLQAAFFTIIQWQRRFGPNPLQRFSTVAQVQAFNGSTSLGFGPSDRNPPVFRYAPFPHLPVVSPIPVAVTAIALFRSDADPNPAPSAFMNAVGELIAWLYSPDQQRLLAS